MIKNSIAHLKRLGLMSGLVVITTLITLWLVGTVGAAPPLTRLFAGPPPTMTNYQGTVQVSGTPYDGDGYFKFAIVDSESGNGSANFWANDGTANGVPGTAVELPVSNGLFNVLLGDTSLTGMSQPLEDTVFSETNTFLRVWFSQNAGGPFEALEPNQQIASVPYALRAKYAENVPTGSAAPSGAVMFFDLASCPAGWTEMAEAQGRVVVGIDSTGTLSGTVGTQMADLENRTHTHDIDPASVSSSTDGNHTHTVDPPTAPTSSVGNHTHSVNPPTTGTTSGGSHSHVAFSFNGSSWTAGSGEGIFTWNSGGVATDSGSTFRPLTRISAESYNTSTTGTHAHSVNIPTFTSGSGGSHSHTVNIPPFSAANAGTHSHTVDIANTTSATAATGEVMPYLQLLTCRKN